MSDVLAKQVAQVLVGFGVMGTPHMQHNTIIAEEAGFCADITSMVLLLTSVDNNVKNRLFDRYVRRKDSYYYYLFCSSSKVWLFFVS